MLYTFMIITVYILDLFIKLAFLDGILGKTKRKISVVPYTVILIAAEILPYINSVYKAQTNGSFPFLFTVITCLISTLLVLLLTLLYDASWSLRLFSSVFFFLLTFTVETLFTILLEYANPAIMGAGIPNSYLSVYMDFGSKLALFLLTLIVTGFRNTRDGRKESVFYNILLCMTPVFTLVLIVILPLNNIMTDVVHTGNVSFLFILFISVCFMNITDYLLIEKIKSANELENYFRNMEQQMKFQREKYVQLSSYYKNMRSILHDMKNHYFTISNYIKTEEYGKLQAYMENAIQTMESCYAGVNTGNLVIDAFLNHFKMLSETERITLREEVAITPDKLPLTDYDLCVVIGNLLDNAYNAVSKMTGRDKTIDVHISVGDNDSLVIFVKNTYDRIPPDVPINDSLEHGYGLGNIEKIVESYHGVMQCKADEYYAVTIVIPVLTEKRCQ